MKALLFDTETTGATNPEIIEAAWVELDTPSTLNIINTHNQRYKPSKRIELGALATHHIYDEELEFCPPSSSFKLPTNVGYIIGHNVDYDWNVAGCPDTKRICTLALSRKFYPEADSHSQSALVYLLDRANARERLKNAHSALADVQNCLLILKNIIKAHGNISTWEDLWLLSEQSRLPTHMPFGKHKGLPISSVPADYKAWLLRQDNVDPYLIAALKSA